MAAGTLAAFARNPIPACWRRRLAVPDAGSPCPDRTQIMTTENDRPIFNSTTKFLPTVPHRLTPLVFAFLIALHCFLLFTHGRFLYYIRLFLTPLVHVFFSQDFIHRRPICFLFSFSFHWFIYWCAHEIAPTGRYNAWFDT